MTDVLIANPGLFADALFAGLQRESEERRTSATRARAFAPANCNVLALDLGTQCG